MAPNRSMFPCPHSAIFNIQIAEEAKEFNRKRLDQDNPISKVFEEDRLVCLGVHYYLVLSI